jgi:hypothetical protein
VSLLSPHHASSIPNRTSAPPPPIYIDDRPEFEVAQILDSRQIGRQIQYLTDFVGYPPHDRLWLPFPNLANSMDLLLQFHRQFPRKPFPPELAPRLGLKPSPTERGRNVRHRK